MNIEQLKDAFAMLDVKKNPAKKYHLIFGEQTWYLLRLKGIYNFTDEQMQAALKSKNGFICESNGIELYLTPKFK